MKTNPPNRLDKYVVLLFAVAVAFSIVVLRPSASPDLLAAWLAGHFYSIGELQQIYPHDTEIFRLNPPPAWTPYLEESGYVGEVYPYLYPPLWVVVMSWVTPFLTPEGMSRIAGPVNSALLFGMVVLTMRMTTIPQQTRRVAYLMTLAILFLSEGGVVALLQNQPQILVSFLIILAMERNYANRPASAGAALAVAASLKLYPILFAALFVAQGQRKSAGWALVYGVGLGLLSILFAGWHLHEKFLLQTSIVSGTIIMTPLNQGFDTAIALLGSSDAATRVEAVVLGLEADTVATLKILTKPTYWKAVSIAMMIGAVLITALISSNRTVDSRYYWPIAICSVAFFSPLSWAYYYLPVLALTAVLYERLPTRTLIPALLPLLFPTGVTIVHSIGNLSNNHLIHKAFLLLMSTPFFGILTMLWLSALFVFAARKA